jgi:hypothetical protein
MKQPLYSSGAFGLSPRNSLTPYASETQDNHPASIMEFFKGSGAISRFYLFTMRKILQLGMAILAVSGISGCSRGYDPTQVTTTKNAAGETTYVLIAPIKGKPFADGAQYLMDNLVKSQAGGDIQSIKVDPASVQVVFSELEYQTQDFVIVGKARITFVGSNGPRRTMPQCRPVLADMMNPTSAYTEGLSAWTKRYGDDASGNYWGGALRATVALNQQLSLFGLVQEITNRGSVSSQAMNDWCKADTYAWSKWYPLYLAESKKAQAQ